MAPKEHARVLTWEVVVADPDADFDKVMVQIKAISFDGMSWSGGVVEPHVFGLSKIVIVCRIETQDDLQDKIKDTLEALSTEDLDISATVVNIDFQEIETPFVKKVVEAVVEEEEEEEAAPPAKPVKEVRRVVTWEVVVADPDADFQGAIAKVKAIKMEGMHWAGGVVEPHVFGLSKIVIVSNIDTPDDLQEPIKLAIEALSTEDEDISATAVNVDFQEIDTPKPKMSEVDLLKKDLAAEKKKTATQAKKIAALEAQLAGGAKGGKGGAPAAKKEKKEEAPLPAGLDRKTMSKCEQDGSAKSKEFKKMFAEYGNKFFASGLPAPEGNLAGLKVALASCNKSSPETGKLLLSDSVENLAVVCWVPEAEAGVLSAKDWLEASMVSVGGMAVAKDFELGTDGVLSLNIPADGKNGQFPIKMKDEIVGTSFGVLRTKGLLAEDDEDETMDVNLLGEC